MKQKQTVNDLEQYIETPDDLMHLINERASFASAESIRRNDQSYLNIDSFLKPLFNGDEVGRRLEQKFNIRLVEFAVRNVHGQMNRMYLAHVFAKSQVSILNTILTKDEIIDFLKDITNVSKLHDQYGGAFAHLRSQAARFDNNAFESISIPRGEGPNQSSYTEKRIAIFTEYFAVDLPWEKWNELFINCLTQHDPELLQVIFDWGYQDSVLSVTTDMLEGYEQQSIDAFNLQKNEEQRKVLNHLRGRLGKSEYNDYYKLKQTIDLLINNNFLELGLFKVPSTHDLIMKEFKPTPYVLIRMVESAQCDMPTLMLFLRTFVSPNLLQSELLKLMKRTAVEMATLNQFEVSQRACQFLHDHYSELPNDMKEVLVRVLNDPDIQVVKEKFFNDLGI